MSIKQGEYLRKLRVENRLSQEQLAEKLGISRQSISKWEQGNATPDTENIVKLSEIYGVSAESILFGEDRAPASESTTATATQPTGATQSTAVPPYMAGSGGAEFESPSAESTGNTAGAGSTAGTQNTTGTQSSDGDVNFNFNNANRENANVNQSLHSSGSAENGETEPQKKQKKKRSTLYFIYPVLAVILFLVVGLLGGWLWSWLFILTIPLYYTFIKAKETGNAFWFMYPFLAIIIYFALSFITGGWWWTWIVFLTIPLYYLIVRSKRQK